MILIVLGVFCVDTQSLSTSEKANIVWMTSAIFKEVSWNSFMTVMVVMMMMMTTFFRKNSALRSGFPFGGCSPHCSVHVCRMSRSLSRIRRPI